MSEAGVLRCPECGAAGDPDRMRCDHCDAILQRRICERREQSAAFVGLGSPLPAPGAHATVDTVRYVACPECGKLMNRVNFARHSGVVVDICKRHGTWFDKDELGRILDFIASGGIDWARDKETEKKLRAMQERIERRIDAVTPPAPGPQTRSMIESVEGLLGWLVR